MYYAIPRADQWIKMGDSIFKPQIESDFGDDDSGFYSMSVPAHTRWYSFLRNDFTYFEKGYDRKVAEYLMLYLDNFGSYAGFGDEYEKPTLANFAFKHLNFWAMYYGDGRYKWAANRIKNARFSKWRFLQRRQRWAFNTDSVEPVEPTDLIGIRYAPLSKERYDFIANVSKKRQTVPLESSVDKLTLRQGLDHDDQFMVIDGLNCGIAHDHEDGGAVVRFCDNGRIFLIDDHYTKRALAIDHSRISVHCKGDTSKNPGCLGVDGIADFDDRAFVRLIMPDYAGMNWTRNIFWRKGEYYLFIDQLETLKQGNYELKNTWKALGVSTAIKDGLAFEQQGQWMHLQAVDHGDFDVETIDVVKDPKRFSRFPNNFKEYTLSEPLVNFCRQTVKCQIAAGERVIFTTLITTANTPNPGYLLTSNTNCYTVKGPQGDETVAINGRNITFGPQTFTLDPAWQEKFKIKYGQ